MRLPFIVLHGVVLRALVARGRRRMAIVPIIILLFLIARYYQRQQYLAPVVAQQLFSAFQAYGIAAARTVLVVGFRELLHIFGLVGMETPLRFLGIHLFGYLISVLLRKKDAQTVFHRGRRVSGILLFIYGVTLGGR
ncbi:MAG: hypothetical protein Q8O99_00545 [bacterium]|nr:hypothetical protein [bacterium]